MCQQAKYTVLRASLQDPSYFWRFRKNVAVSSDSQISDYVTGNPPGPACGGPNWLRREARHKPTG